MIHSTREGRKRERHEYDEALVCERCKQDERNARRRGDRYDESHGDANNHTTLKVLVVSPQRRRLRRRFNNRKRVVKTARQKQQRLDAVLDGIKSRKNSVYVKVPATTKEGDPGALHGVVSMIVDAIAEEMAESNHEANVPLDESKRMSGLERETTILFLLNESLSDEE